MAGGSADRVLGRLERQRAPAEGELGVGAGPFIDTGHERTLLALAVREDAVGRRAIVLGVLLGHFYDVDLGALSRRFSLVGREPGCALRAEMLRLLGVLFPGAGQRACA